MTTHQTDPAVLPGVHPGDRARRGSMVHTHGRSHGRSHGSLRASWPVHRRQTLELVSGWVALTVVWIVLGKLLTGPFASSWIVRTDRHIANWMVAHRTPTWNHVTVWGSLLAETTTKVVVTVVLGIGMLVAWRRWFEPMVMVLSLVIEAAAFIVVTTIVGRQRPDVARLDGSPVGSSFPSGHTAAAAAYLAIVAIVFWHTRKRWARWLVAAVTALVPVVVALARIYRGMHFLSDTIAGAVLGTGSVVLTVLVLGRSAEGAPITGPGPERAPADAGELAAADRGVR